MEFDPDEVQGALRKAWSLSTASQWTTDNPAAGQCNVTALLIHDLFGGELLKTPLPQGDHFYNRIEGRRYDSRLVSSISRSRTWTYLPVELRQSEEQQTTSWLNSELLFRSTIRSQVRAAAGVALYAFRGPL
ncbi:hypothetical protein SAMN05216338_1015168 [Bradyrhizobium sp. Rc2d]|uniref:YunG family protein n=1 Tax=Bradyrhizobium sp. Rc2d TaxID=1855321 RepID=UPI00087F1984|nr:hypothetical protein SAMN05216338_1015168 [Bradyrhizobium sp. Rc2d]